MRIFGNVKVMPGASLNSDHRLLVSDLYMSKIKMKQKPKRNIINIEGLKDQTIKD